VRWEKAAGGMKILVAEDDAIIADDLMSAILAMGFEALGPVAQSSTALRLSAAARPELALLNVRLRGGSGMELARALYDQCGCCSLFVTGDPDEVRESEAPGVLGVLLKPYSVEAVAQSLDCVRQLLAGRTPKDVPADLKLFTRTISNGPSRTLRPQCGR
jgi:two-component system, response regulator PdtaR